MTAKQVFKGMFEKARDARSNEYKQGVMAWLEYKLEKKEIDVPYKQGTCQFDAFFAGLDEGKKYQIN
jgi:hypothetical protein